MRGIQQLLQQHALFQDLPEADLTLIGGCGENCVYNAGEYIARENAPADFFYVIREGRVAVETYMPNHGALCLQTLHDGDIFGWSWLFPPYRWTFDARALEKVRAVRLDGKCLRQKCEEDPRLGFELMKRFARIVTERLQATRLQLLDVYSSERPRTAETRQ
ncbi:Cyclic nucleotide-binding domain-containing protein [Microbulbifer donghaiensis]|uniref:Cyclic nucleotide-binding domain-containing protein n=1 Tax=Microbulbifer donghaiensis TaxID=494016 RepID=A0A1M4UNZ6_9GAMM|nr:cyclic nucleotide-binding domain-containing protein [Microbulbifer donghaiensis]SHE58377.1 Cyclic nucleotide-binding domain-containing protein [Microbulbifer donghaiensis]